MLEKYVPGRIDGNNKTRKTIEKTELPQITLQKLGKNMHSACQYKEIARRAMPFVA